MPSMEKALQIAYRALINNAAESPGGPRNWAAAEELKERRNNPNTPADDDLALAEHYLVARAYVSNGVVSCTNMKAMILGYYGLKLTMENAGALQGLRHNFQKPVTPPSYKQVIIGFLGAEEGERERQMYPPGVKPPLYPEMPDFVGKR